MPSGKTKRPNVVVFVTDQQRADTIPGGTATGRVTPHLDWLASRSVTFRNAFCSTPICSPSRASLLSGLYPHSHGLVANHQPRPISRDLKLAREIPLLADMMAPHGYACGYSGKWHLGTGSDRRGFTSFVARNGKADVSDDADNEIATFAAKVGVTLGGKQSGADPDPDAFDKRLKTGASKLPMAWHPSHRDAVAAADFIRGRAGQTDPFLLVYSCHEPHVPFVAPRPFDRAVSPGAVTLPSSWQHTIDPGIVARRAPWKLQGVNGRLSEEDLKSIWAAYLGAVSYADHLLGVVLEALLDTDALDDTILVFTSDHGDMLGAHNVLLKGAVLYDEVVKVPLMMKVPGLSSERSGASVDSLVSLVDLVPTLLSLCGLPASTNCQGRDFSPLFRDGTKEVHRGIPLEFHSSNWGERPSPLRGWRTREWKLVKETTGPVELYDLRRDPHEVDNRVHDPALANVVAQLEQELGAWMKQTGDRWPHVPQPAALVEDGTT